MLSQEPKKRMGSCFLVASSSAISKAQPCVLYSRRTPVPLGHLILSPFPRKRLGRLHGCRPLRYLVRPALSAQCCAQGGA